MDRFRAVDGETRIVLGLDRSPEVKTVRRKLARLAAQHKAEELGRKLASLRVERHGAMMGFLYVDGHVRAYHGKRDIPKTHVARIRLAMPAITDYSRCSTSSSPRAQTWDPSKSELRVVLHTLSSPHRTATLASLCEALNETATRFPGSNLTLRFETAPLPPTCFAFPGPRPAVEAADSDQPDMK